MKLSGDDVALAALLQRVVADRRGRIERLVDVAGIEDALLIGLVAPDAGEAIGLKLEAHGERVRLRLARVPPGQVDFGQDAEEVLHVVADLVRDHVGLGEVAGRAELALELVVEGEVDIELLVAGQ